MPQFTMTPFTNPSVQNTPKPTGQGFNIKDLANLLPGIGGTAGQVIGGGLGTAGGAVAGGGPEDVPADVVGEKIGQSAGGAIGQAGGDFLKQFLLSITGNQKGINTGEVLSEGVQGGLYGLTPFGKSGAGVIKNLLTRGAGGALTAGGAQAVQDISSGKKPGGDVLAAGAVGGALNATTGGILDTLSGIRGVGSKVADDIQKSVVEKPQQVAQNALREAHETMVSPKHYDYAVENGIIDSNSGMSAPHIAQALQKTQSISNDIETSIQNNIQNVTVDKAEQDQLRQGIQTILQNHGLSPVAAKSLEKELKGDEFAAIQRVRNLLFGRTDNKPISLSVVNQAKRLLAPVYDEKGVTGDLYRYLQKSIENKSGNGDVLKELNQQARNTAEIRQNLIKHQEKSIPHRLTDQGIQEQVEKSRTKVSPELKNFAHILDLLGGTAGFVVGHGFLGYLIGRGMAESAVRAAETPEAQEQFAGTLKKVLRLQPSDVEKMHASTAKRLLQSLGIRLTPGIMGLQSQQVQQ